MSTALDLSLADLKSTYKRNGWFKFPERLSGQTIKLLRERAEAISQERRPEVVFEKDGCKVRAIHGCHAFDEACQALVRLPCLVEMAEELIGGPVYLYQFKVNFKQAHEGDAWPWHQDFAFWREEDGMPRPDAVNFAISLDDVHEENGPLAVIPGSHRLGLLDLPEKDANDMTSDWRQHVSADLAYTVSPERAEKLTEQYGKVLVLGRAGSIHAFHPSIVHSSPNNLSADRRALLLLTYNAVNNAPASPTRPAFLVDRNTAPVVPQDDERFAFEMDE
ncbi:phytanoyl-CoA dioxygenase family protein [Streptomyces griseoviridis]|uniref:phytanoyl-CoA dioxygenase family protein n=1 Tax=Streptomyces TaxID=1883 RepID=UPI0024746BE4|nr:phytanoyl-CoA dioxygenase family protein [Streptomyces sp. MAA16]MDH6703283.1 ectoine hydroxylase [Streptomyces sp. MAA16]